MVAELVLERVAATLNKSPLAVREPMLYKDGDTTHFGMVMEGCQVVPCWESVLKQAGGWQERRAAADEFNSKVCKHMYERGVGIAAAFLERLCRWQQACDERASQKIVAALFWPWSSHN